MREPQPLAPMGRSYADVGTESFLVDALRPLCFIGFGLPPPQPSPVNGGGGRAEPPLPVGAPHGRELCPRPATKPDLYNPHHTQPLAPMGRSYAG